MWKQTLIALVLSLVAAELLLRWVDYPAQPEWGWKWDRSPYVFEDHRATSTLNDFDLRGQPFTTKDDEWVVALVGDSYIETGHLATEYTPEQLLQHELRNDYGVNAKVYSLASAGWGLDQQLLALQQFFDQGQRADVVIVWLTPINDYWESTFVDRSVGAEAGPLKPTWFKDPETAEWQWYEPKQSPSKIMQMIQLALNQGRYGKQGTQELALRAQQQALLPSSERQHYASAAQCQGVVTDQYDMVITAKEHDQLIAQTHEAFAEGRSHFVPFADPLTPLEQYQVEVHHHLLGQLRDLAQQNGAKFAFVTPVGSDLDRTLNKVQCVIDEQGRYVRFDYQSGLRHIRGTELEAAFLPAQLDSEQSTILSRTDWHLNELGNQLFIQSMAQQMAEHNLLP